MGRRRRGFGFDDLTFIVRDLAPERLGLAFDPLGIDVETAQFAALGEADPCRRHPDHPQRRQQYGSAIQAERAVPRTEAGVAVLAVVLGVLQRHRT